MLTDGGGADEAESQQIHLLSPAISQRNWRQFVSFGWQQIWKHYVKKPSGKKAVCVVTKIYKSAKVIKRKKKKKRNNWVRQTCYSAGELLTFDSQCLSPGKKILFDGIWCHVNFVTPLATLTGFTRCDYNMRLEMMQGHEQSDLS